MVQIKSWEKSPYLKGLKLMIGTLCNDNIWIIVLVRGGERKLKFGWNGNNKLLVLPRRAVSNILGKKRHFQGEETDNLGFGGVASIHVKSRTIFVLSGLNCLTKKQKQKTMLLLVLSDKYRWDSLNRPLRRWNSLPNMKQVWVTKFSSQILTCLLRDWWGSKSNFFYGTLS